ncbi:MAG: ABC transporter ATP-binding protein [Verrucomicrobiae bacterium]|nr:ABC transporter ATP-binding protein [Verrucomicrobiae bacterium]
MATIQLRNVQLDFTVYEGSSLSLKKHLMRLGSGGRIARDSRNRRVVHALRDVDLDLQAGDRVGLIGPNGSGKTSLLRLLAGIYEPTGGQITVTGQTASLLDVNLGLDHESTGYENIFIRGCMLGFSRAQIEERIDEVIGLSGLGEFLDLPIRTYSVGMQYRLAFSVFTLVQSDILLLDETIGVGDEAFVSRVHDRVNRWLTQSRIFILSAHSPPLIRKFCNKILWMQQGRIHRLGPVDSVLTEYLECSRTTDK